MPAGGQTSPALLLTEGFALVLLNVHMPWLQQPTSLWSKQYVLTSVPKWVAYSSDAESLREKFPCSLPLHSYVAHVCARRWKVRLLSRQERRKGRLLRVKPAGVVVPLLQRRVWRPPE